MRYTAVLAIVLGLLLCPAARADWNPGEPHKMHFPQLPDPEGWDVNMMWPKVLADDWRCAETGPVSDIHFWFSVERDDPLTLDLLRLGGIVHTSIHADIPAQPGTHSRPGALLWEREFPVGPGGAFFREYGQGPQGWYNPNTGEFRRPDHFMFYQMNIEGIVDPFIQEQGTIYWLDLSIRLPTIPPNGIGWKTSLDHFNDDAVWGDLPNPMWQELRDPTTGVSLDLAFVITPEPGSVVLLTIGALALLRRR